MVKFFLTPLFHQKTFQIIIFYFAKLPPLPPLKGPACICKFPITYSHTSVPNLVKNSHHVYDYLLLHASHVLIWRGRGRPGIIINLLSEDTPNLVTMGLADLYHLSYPLCTILGISEFAFQCGFCFTKRFVKCLEMFI